MYTCIYIQLYSVRCAPMSRCLLQYTQPCLCACLTLPSASSIVYVLCMCIQIAIRAYILPHVNSCSLPNLHPHPHPPVYIFTLVKTSIPAFTYTCPPLSLGMYLPILICRYLPVLATLRTHSILVHTYSEAYVLTKTVLHKINMNKYKQIHMKRNICLCLHTINMNHFI